MKDIRAADHKLWSDQQQRKGDLMAAGHPWLNPLPRRIAVTIFCAGWLAFEVWQQSTVWLVIAVCVLGYAIWDFFLSGNYGDETSKNRPYDEDN